MDALKRFLKTETVLAVSLLAAVITAFFVPPSVEYLAYLDLRVLVLLFCLMAVVAGLRQIDVFGVLAQKLTAGSRKTRSLCLALVLLCFFSSMLITNDVALITFVPFAILVLTVTGQTHRMILVVTLQTVAANLGSMLTPVGNPQNLYLYSRYQIPAGEFFSITLPVTIASLVLVAALCFLVKNETVTVVFQTKEVIRSRPKLVLYLALFVLCLLTVLHLVHYLVPLGAVCIALLAVDRGLFRKIDYGLLLTFVCFFIFVGNLGNIPAVRDWLAALIVGRELAAAVLLSQVISNVPAAVLLSAFTDQYRALVLGTDIGGLGTLVASLASLISFKLYCASENAKPLKFLGVFTGINLAALAALLVFSTLVGLL